MDIKKKIPDRFLSIIEEIPAIPDVVVKVMQLTRNPDVTAKELTDMISNDPGLTGNILRLCNSAYYGIPRVVSSLNQAVMYLGFHTIRSLVLTCSINSFFNPKQPVYGYVNGGIWHHSVACAITSELICNHVRPELHDSAFTAGLLHDIGQLILGISIKDTSETIIDMMINGGVDELQAENDSLGFTHEELGAHLANAWNFPDDLIHAICHHHHPLESKTQTEMTSIIHIADAMALELGFGIELEQMKFNVDPAALAKFGLNHEWLASMREEASALIDEKATQFMEILN